MESIINMMISEETQFILNFAQLGLLAVVIWRVAVIYSELKNKIKDNDSRIDKVESDNEDMSKEHNLIKITQAVLETKLENIEAGVEEIKAILLAKIKK